MTTTAILTPDLVQAVFLDCLFTDEEEKTDYVVAEGLTMNVGFHPRRLEGHREDILLMLDELPDDFKSTSDSGGWSFLNACVDKHGNLWTGEHRTVEMLVLLGIAIGRVEFLAPRELWAALPGGMPYFVVK